MMYHSEDHLWRPHGDGYGQDRIPLGTEIINYPSFHERGIRYHRSMVICAGFENAEREEGS